MRILDSIVGLIMFLSFSWLGGCQTTLEAEDAFEASQTGNQRLHDEVLAQCAKMEQAMRDNDLIKVASFYADHAILLSPGGETHGGSREALEEYWTGFGQGIDWSLLTITIEGIDDFLVQRGRSVLTYNRNGDRRTSDVEFVLFWQRQDDGELRITVDGYW